MILFYKYIEINIKIIYNIFKNKRDNMSKTLTDNELYMMNDYFKALNYLSVGQLYLMDNPLLRRP